MVRLLEWNGKDLPSELKNLPPGRYVVQSADVAPALNPEDEDALIDGLAQLDRGEGVPANEVYRQLGQAIKR